MVHSWPFSFIPDIRTNKSAPGDIHEFESVRRFLEGNDFVLREMIANVKIKFLPMIMVLSADLDPQVPKDVQPTRARFCNA